VIDTHCPCSCKDQQS